MFGEYITILESLYIMLVSITIVFGTLVVIALILYSFKFIFKEEDTSKKDNNTKKIEVKKEKRTFVNMEELVEDEEKLVASIVCTIEANKEDEDKTYKITNIREI